jgi:hypothetical protein
MTTHAPTPECDAFDATLAEYLEHTLSADDAALADAHRATCERCDALVRELDTLRVDAAQLPPLTPSHDLWPGIAARIGTPVSSLDRARVRQDRSRTWISARAAAAIVLLTAGTTYVVARWTTRPSPYQAPVAVARTPDTTRVAAVTPPAVTVTPNVATPKTVTPVVARKQSTQATYAQEIAGLHAIVEQRSTQLDPHTRAVIEHNLQVIDTAIAESRRALANDPHSAFLADQLDQALDTKLELMRTVALLPART